MKPFSFIHAADLHIGSPFKGISVESAEVAEQLQKSTFSAFDALIKACIDHQVNFLLVAGDVYDGADRSLSAQLHFRDGLKQLADAGIRSFVVHGNHDPLDGRVSTIEWPQEVHNFGKAAETVTVEVDGESVASVSGISFPKKNVEINLAKKLKPGPDHLFQIGLLHCNVGKDTGHDPYAPCELGELQSSGFNYWALGHVHTRTKLSENPWVVYPGNSQGRSIREQGARGCYLVRVDRQCTAEMEFVPLDVVRWHQTSVSILDIESLDALDRRLVEVAEALPEAGRDVVCRISIEGRGPLYKELRNEGAEAELLQRIRQNLESSDPLIWVQRIELNCLPQVDLQQRAEQGDLLAEVLTLANETAESPAGLQRIEADALDDLWKNPRAKKGLAPLDDADIRKILDQAKLLCLDLLEEEE